MTSDGSENSWLRWARLRFSIIGGLLASPPGRGELQKKLAELAGKPYRHPTKRDEWIIFGVSTIERWYYRALGVADPIDALGRKLRRDAGRKRVMKPELVRELELQYRTHRKWSYQLHFENLEALVKERPELAPMPSYPTVRRLMQSQGWSKQRSPGRNRTPGQQKAFTRLEKREVRSYEASHVHALWHLDFHEGRRQVVDSKGRWHVPVLLAVLDDLSRLCCHIQWYLRETAENLFHGLVQAFLKRGLPRAQMMDNGAAMIAHETRAGLLRLGIQHELTLAYSPYQNGKQEAFWGSVEGRLMPMLERVEPLTLAFLNRATSAWAELEYNRRHHSELGATPLERMVQGQDVSRPAPAVDELRLAFTVREARTQRQSDGTISVDGVRFEVPSRLRHLRRLQVRYQSWDLSVVYLVDGRTDHLLARIYPLDKARNADGRRRVLEPVFSTAEAEPEAATADPLPPLMRRLLADYAATGLPPAYLPKDETKEEENE